MPGATSASGPSGRGAGAADQSGRSRWTLYLSLVVLAQLVLLLHWLPRDRAVLARIDDLRAPLYRLQRARHLASLMRADPPLGFPVALGRANELGAELRRAAPGRWPAVVVLIGACSACVERDLQDWEDAATSYGGRKVIIVSRETRGGVAGFLGSAKLRLPIIADPDGTIEGRLNPVWAGRAYAVSPDGRVTWIQTNPDVPVGAIARQVWAEGRG